MIIKNGMLWSPTCFPLKIKRTNYSHKIKKKKGKYGKQRMTQAMLVYFTLKAVQQHDQVHYTTVL